MTGASRSLPGAEERSPETILRERFVARMLGSLGDVVGARAGLALLQYMACKAVSGLLADELVRHRGLGEVIGHVTRSLGLRMRVVVQSPDRIELEAAKGPFTDSLSADAQAALLRGLFQGIVASTTEGVGWGVLVAESAAPVRITVTRGIA